MMGVTTLADAVSALGVTAGFLGVWFAVYIQLISPRKCDPGHVIALFIAGSAGILLFAGWWSRVDQTDAILLQLTGVLLFFVAEGVAVWTVWHRGEVGGPVEAYHTIVNDRSDITTVEVDGDADFTRGGNNGD